MTIPTHQRQTYLTAREAAGVLGISNRRVCRLFDSGRLTGFRTPTTQRARRIAVDSLRACMSEAGMDTGALERFLEGRAP